MPPPPNPATSPAANRPGTGRVTRSGPPAGPGTRTWLIPRPDRSVCRPPRVLRVKMLSRTAISGPALGSRILCSAAVRASRSPRNRPAVVADRHDLQVRGERVVDLPVAGDDLPLEVGHVDQRLAGQLVHARDQLGQGPGHHAIAPALLERLHRSGGAGPDPGQGEPDVLAGQVGVLLRT